MMEASSGYSFFHDQILFSKWHANINSPAWTQFLNLICHAASEVANTNKRTTQAHNKLILTQLCSKTPENKIFEKHIYYFEL